MLSKTGGTSEMSMKVRSRCPIMISSPMSKHIAAIYFEKLHSKALSLPHEDHDPGVDKLNDFMNDAIWLVVRMGWELNVT